MLQQTRVAAVIEYYHEFLRRFPTLEKLAAARQARVLAAWSGLGYYRRARMLHAAAKVVVREHGGKLPATAEGLRDLPGIGRYTAAAIASIAFGEPVAVVDGNVERVLQRLSGKRLAGEELWGAAGGLLDPKRPGDFNQAMMELGATVCTPRSPACLACPVIEMCATTRGELPARAKAARQKREIHYALHCGGGEAFLVQRDRDASLMPEMWELPEVDAPASGAKALRHKTGEIAVLKALRHPKSKHDATLKCAAEERAGVRAYGRSELCLTLRHSITVTDYTVRVWRNVTPSCAEGKWIPVERLGQVALTGLTRKILRKAGILSRAAV